MRSAGGGVVLLAGGSLLLGGDDAPGAEVIDTFVSRPDLAPPQVRVTSATDASDGYVFLAPMSGPGQHGPMIVDQHGQLVWFRPLSGATAANFGVQTYEGQPVLVWWEGRITHGHGEGDYVIANSSYEEIHRVRAAHGLTGDLHEFVISPNGTALFSTYQAKPADLSSVGGPRHGTLLDSTVQEVDVATGALLFEWTASEHVPLSESHLGYGGGAYDFFHVNSIDIGADGNLLVSARHTWAVYNIRRRDGKIRWRLGGKSSDFAAGPGAQFYWQHDARWQPDGTITIFDDGDGPSREEPRSRGIRIALDLPGRKARLVQSYTHTGYLAKAMGSMQPLPGGDAFIGWGTVPAFTRYRPDGTIRLDAYLVTSDSYRAFLQPWTGQPAEAPAVAIAHHNREPYAYASWNGATTVARWQLNTGPIPTRLHPQRTATSAGFETPIPVGTTSGYLNVDALDATGRHLASSPPVPISRTTSVAAP